MSLAAAVVRTPDAQHCLGRFCRHFARRCPVELAADHGSGVVSFGFGPCRLVAEADVLVLKLEAATAAHLARLKDVTERHLGRFAHGTPLPIDWVDADEAMAGVD